MSDPSGLMEKEMEDEEQYQPEKLQEECAIDEDRRPIKRNRSEDEEGWIEAGKLSFSAVVQKPHVEVTTQPPEKDTQYNTAKKPQTKPHKPKQTEKPVEYETWIEVDAMDSQEIAEEDEKS
ncbi:unnamed protein product [Spodoptera exigua]|nr:unnamed protein product [Spodoptera exigua]